MVIVGAFRVRVSSGNFVPADNSQILIEGRYAKTPAIGQARRYRHSV